MLKNTAYQEFQRVCGENLSTADVRRLVLFKTNGMCPINKLVDGDGVVLSIGDVCKKTESIMKKRGWGLNPTYGEEKANELKRGEENEKGVVLTSAQKARLSTMVSEHEGQSLKTFREALMKSRLFKIHGIHFFHWDGSCRDLNGICRALKIYAPEEDKIVKWARRILFAAWLFWAIRSAGEFPVGYVSKEKIPFASVVKISKERRHGGKDKRASKLPQAHQAMEAVEAMPLARGLTTQEYKQGVHDMSREFGFELPENMSPDEYREFYVELMDAVPGFHQT